MCHKGVGSKRTYMHFTYVNYVYVYEGNTFGATRGSVKIDFTLNNVCTFLLNGQHPETKHQSYERNILGIYE